MKLLPLAALVAVAFFFGYTFGDLNGYIDGANDAAAAYEVFE